MPIEIQIDRMIRPEQAMKLKGLRQWEWRRLECKVRIRFIGVRFIGVEMIEGTIVDR